jgi:quinol monooxygenase YgiN
MSELSQQFVVIAEFTAKPGQRQALLAVAFEDARASLANEEGCLAFDVLTSAEFENLVVLHEVYTSAAAFEAHKEMPHYAPFKTHSAPLIDGTPVVRVFAPAVLS